MASASRRVVAACSLVFIGNAYGFAQNPIPFRQGVASVSADRVDGCNRSSLANDFRGGDAANNDRMVSLSLVMTYLTVMGAKCALPSVLAILSSPESGLAHTSEGMSRQDVISRLLAVSTLSIAMGKMLLGPAIDALGGATSLQIALATLCACLGGISSATSLTVLALYFVVIDFAFSSCWAACVKTIRDALPEDRWSKEIGNLAMAARCGNTVAFAFFAWLLQTSGDWRMIFQVSSAVQLIPLCLVTYVKRRTAAEEEIYESSSEPARASSPGQALNVLRREAATPEYWLHLGSRSILMILVSFLLFIPSFMAQCYDMAPASSAKVGSIFALGCFLSVSLLSERSYPSTNKGDFRRSFSMLGFLMLSTLTLVCQVLHLQDIMPLSSIIGSTLMFIWGFSLAVPFYLPSSMFALRRGGKEASATISDSFDIVGFGLLVFFNGRVARVLSEAGSYSSMSRRRHTWLSVFKLMTGMSIAAAMTLFGAVGLEDTRQCKTESP